MGKGAALTLFIRKGRKFRRGEAVIRKSDGMQFVVADSSEYGIKLEGFGDQLFEPSGFYPA